MLAFDLETYLISHDNPLPKPVSLARGGDGDLYLYSDAAAVETLAWDSLVGANVAYDMGVIYQHTQEARELIWEKYANGDIHDVLVAARLLDTATSGKQRHSYSLASVASAYGGLDLEKGSDTWRLRYSELDGIPIEQWPEDAVSYARNDAIATQVAADAIWQRGDLILDEPLQTRKLWWLSLTSVWGIRTDEQAIRQLADSLGAQAAECERMLVEVGLVNPARVTRTGKHIPPKRNAKYARTLVERAPAFAGNPPRTDKGSVSISDDTCQKSGDSRLETYGRYGQIRSRLDKEVKQLRADGQYLIRTRWNSPLETGRTSTSPNVQNFGRDGLARNCIIPAPGYHILGADYSGLELATFAQVCLWAVGFSHLANALNQGIDVHSDFGVELAPQFGDWQTLDAARNAGDPEAKQARQLAKIGNFGYQGGMGPQGLVGFASGYGIKLTLDQAQGIRERWFGKWPEARPYFDWISRQNGRVVHFLSQRIRNNSNFCQAANSYFQGLGADVTGWAGFTISRACYTRQPCVFCNGSGCESCGNTGVDALYGCRPSNYIHDEYLLDCPIGQGHWAGLSLVAHMKQAGEIWVPDVALSAEPVLMTRWSKDAKPVYEDGELVPWEA